MGWLVRHVDLHALPFASVVIKLLARRSTCLVPPAGPLVPNGPPMTCAGPSVRVGPVADDRPDALLSRPLAEPSGARRRAGLRLPSRPNRGTWYFLGQMSL